MEELFLYLIIITFGLCIGSFLNVCAYRIPLELSIISPGSACPACGTRLRALDLVPLLSQLYLGGKCRYCAAQISWRYFSVELVCGLLFALSFFLHGWSWLTLQSWLLVPFLLLIALIDYDCQLIFDRVLIFLAAFGLAQQWLGGFFAPLETLLSVLVGGGLMLLIALASKGGMGGGDIKFVAALGCWFAWPQILLLLLVAFILGGLIGVALLLSGKKGRKDAVPFGPFLALAALLTLWFSAAWMPLILEGVI